MSDFFVDPTKSPAELAAAFEKHLAEAGKAQKLKAHQILHANENLDRDDTAMGVEYGE